MSKRRKCVFECERPRTFFNLPKDEGTRQKWLEFMYGRAPPPIQRPMVCDGHFTDDCLVNLGQYQSGLSEKLSLKTGAIPTIKYPDAAVTSTCSLGTSSNTGHGGHLKGAVKFSPSVRTVGVQTDIRTMFSRTVSTQLSEGTLKLYTVRSKAVQTTVSPEENNSETQQHRPDISSTSIKVSTAEAESRPLKRPRLEEEEDMDLLPPDSPNHSGSPTLAASNTEASVVVEEEPTALEEAKYIVFESSLMEIFDICPICKGHCTVRRRKCGTLVSFMQKCPHCQYSRKWQSGPILRSTPVGDLQLSAAVYLSGGSFTKVSRVCNAMNIQIHQHNAFRRHSRFYLEPAIYHKWNEDQRLHLEDLNKKGKVAVSGHMTADSPGHIAKYGAYTLMDVQTDKIVDMELVQSNEVGGSHHMEKEGLRRGLDFLEANDLEVDYFVTGCQSHIQKFLRERDVTHYYDVRHVVKGLCKQLDKLSKNKLYKMIRKWLEAIKNHMYWSASSSSSGAERVAKWTSLVNHIQGVHKHDNPLFPKCAHPDKVSRDPKKQFQPGTKVLNKVKKLLMNKRVLSDVTKMSSCALTSSLESFHRVIHRFTPKMSNCNYVERMCRLYLAGMHQNENTKRRQVASKGKDYFKVSYPKYKKCQGTTKIAKNKTTFGYVAALMHLVFKEVFPDPSKFVARLKFVPVPKDLMSGSSRVGPGSKQAPHNGNLKDPYTSDQLVS